MMAGAALLLGACDSGGEEPATPASESSATSAATSSGEQATATAASTTTSLAPVSKVFDAEAMQMSVQQILTQSYRVEGVERVTCPPDQPVEVGLKFDCTAVIAGEPKRVQITVKNENDEYEVGYPR
ncbi:hypothetical protein BAY59_13505 [Prauserella coralliicola]|nr:hypothetical protein BAY59_13505 [Prauserella coralliicola]